MRPRTPPAAAAVAALLAAGLALRPAAGGGDEQIHRHQFGGRQTALVRGDANVRVEELRHDISTVFFHSQPASEHLKLTAEAATGDAAFVHYHYDTPPAPVTPLLSAKVWVKATKPGVQLRARVVFPKEPDPANPGASLTMLVVGRTLEKSRTWEPLTLDDVPALMNRHLTVLRAKVGRDVNTDGAYVDRLVLNLYTGPGTAEVWVDDLDIGPVRPQPRTDPAAPGVPVKNPRPDADPLAGPRGRQVEQRGGRLVVDGKDFLFRAVRHTGTPMHVLRQAGFDTIWFPPDTPAELLADANREGWLVVPSVPLAARRAADGAGAGDDQEAEGIAAVMRKFGSTDVLFWDLGGGRHADEVPRVARTSEVIRRLDPRRPRGADVWDGFRAYSTYLDVIGAHRWPLFTGLELAKYRDWLDQRRELTATSRATFWTWVQNHVPDWYVAQVLDRRPADDLADPIGPHPEQVRIMAHVALACGARGLGFWSDRFLADSHHGRDRLQGAALLNAEIDMLAPVLLAAGDRAVWLDTSDKNVKAAFLKGDRGAVLLPIWLGPGTQFVPPQAAVPALTVTVPLVHDGADPWRVTPAGVECLAHHAEKVPGGTRLTIREFDTACPVVFTSDRPRLVAWWQDYADKYGKLAAKWAIELAQAEYEKVTAVHAKLAARNVTVRGADDLFDQTRRLHEAARVNYAAGLYHKAYLDATRALRPLQVVMHDHWEQAAGTLDTPTASPYAVSYFSLPKHWDLFAEVQRSRPAGNLLPHGDFEFRADVPKAGVRVDALPGWTARFGTLDKVNVAAAVVPVGKLEDHPKPRKAPDPVRGMWAPGRPIPAPDEGYVPPAPELGNSLLRLEVRRQADRGPDGRPREAIPAPLERTFLAVDSPPVRLPPGTLVRVSGWVRVPQEIAGSADGVLFYDDAGGEPLGVRVSALAHWKRFHLYRRVPETGQIAVTVALTGVGVAYFDDLRIEPLVPGEVPAGDAAATAASRGARPAMRPAVVGAGANGGGGVIPAAGPPKRP